MNEISEELLARAMRPELVFGRGVLSAVSEDWGDYLLVTMPEVWEAARGLFKKQPAHILFIDTMDRPRLEKIESELPALSVIVGIGGGMSLDMAKYVGWRRGINPVLCPSIASVDACVTNTIAVRDEGKVHYIGFTVPRAVVSDFELMSKAPVRFNRAGIGDILSIHTGVFDWKLAAMESRGQFVPEVARATSALVDDLEKLTGEIRGVTDQALRWLIEAYAAENEQCLKVGHSRPEEGSEHFLAYNVEHRTGHGYVHGELVCLGVLVMSRLQDNQPERIHKMLIESGVKFEPADLDLTRAELEAALATLPDYVKAEGLPFSIIDHHGINRETIGQALAGLKFA